MIEFIENSKFKPVTCTVEEDREGVRDILKFNPDIKRFPVSKRIYHFCYAKATGKCDWHVKTHDGWIVYYDHIFYYLHSFEKDDSDEDRHMKHFYINPILVE